MSPETGAGSPDTFEAKLARIEAINAELEGGSVDLSRVIELFKEGKALSAQCEALLKSAQDEIDRASGESAPPAPA